jgi:IS5 family transposase
MIALNKRAIEEGLEHVKEFRQDSMVIETNIHYPTNNRLVYDCIKEIERLFEHLKEEINGFSYKNTRGRRNRGILRYKWKKTRKSG